MLIYIYSLPGAETGSTGGNRYGEVCLCKRCPQMSRHIIRSFEHMMKPVVTVDDEPSKKGLHIPENVAVCVFLYQQ
jgi:hypothetical protein